MEGLAFPNRASREPIGAEDAEPEPDKRTSQRGARDFRAMSMNREASSAGAEKAEEGTALKAGVGARPSRTSQSLSHTRWKRIS